MDRPGGTVLIVRTRGRRRAGHSTSIRSSAAKRCPVANWDIVLAYDEQASDWLASQGYGHPPVRPGNRLPTFAEVEEAAVALGIGPDAPLLVDTIGATDSLRMRGDLVLELRLLRY